MTMTSKRGRSNSGVHTTEPEPESFENFAARHELKLKRALVAAAGVDAGTDAAADAMAYAWENFDRVARMDNPGGYLYRVGLNRSRSRRRRPVVLPSSHEHTMPWIEPALPEALAGLPERQRVAVLLVHTFDYSYSEAAEVLGVAKGTVQNHVERALVSLRSAMGVGQ